MKIIKRSEIVYRTSYTLCFDLYEYGCGYAFDCDERGNVDVEKLPDPAKASYAQCLMGSIRTKKGWESLLPPRVEQREHHYRQPSIGVCHCGRHVELGSFTNTCDRCGRDYNSAGQELAQRSQWGEETGETAADIAFADSALVNALDEGD
jgi:hypothetical protein